MSGSAVRGLVSLVVSASLVGCGTVASVKRSVVGGPRLGVAVDQGDFLGGVAADEPQAATIGKQVLAQGGSAADAAAAVGFALAVTLPSRAGLGGGGACLSYVAGGTPEAVLFTSRVPASLAGERPAGVPMLASGLLGLQARRGVLPTAQVIAPAEQLATVGVRMSPTLAADLAVVGGALVADPAAAAVFAPHGAPLGEGDLLVQADLGSSLASLRVHGVADLLHGGLAQSLVAAMPTVGASISAADLQGAVPRLDTPLILQAGADRVAFLPPPADGGLAAAAAFQRLQADVGDLDGAQARALSATVRWRNGGADPGAVLGSAGDGPGGGATLTALPASTSFVTLDRSGGAVACALTMGNLFGTGRIAQGTGILMAASPAAVPSPMLAAAIAWNPGQNGFRAEVAGSGQLYAALGVAVGMLRTLAAKTAMPAIVPVEGRINAIACPRYLPGKPDLCTWATDPRGGGLAAGG